MATTSSDWGVGDDLWTQAKARSAPTPPAAPVSSNPWADSGDASLPAAAEPAKPAAPAAAAPAASPYAPYISEIQQTADPNTRVVAQDSLSRKLYSDLKADGHDVEWDGDNLLVDGKPYSVAGAPTSPATGLPTDSSTPPGGPATPPAPVPPPPPPGLSDADLEKVAGGKQG
jgi:hypothetical protein